MIRDLEPRDQGAARALVLAGMRERWGDRFDEAANPDLDDLWCSYVEAGADVVVVEEEGSIVAMGALVPGPDRTGRILRVAVDRCRRRRGLARAVVAELVRRAERRDLCVVLVSTDTPWSDALSLYAACGFDLISQDEEVSHFSRAIG